MTALRVVLSIVCAVFLPGCGRDNIAGVYRDPANPAVRYELRDGGAWSAEMIVEIPAGVFPHGAGRRLEGKFRRSGDVLELACTSAARQDPISGQFLTNRSDFAAYNHKLLVEEGALVAVGPQGEKEALFATDLNPFGARRLIREAQRQ